MAVEERRARCALEEEREREHDEGEDDLDVCAVEGRRGELARDDLHAVLEVDPGDEEAERVARKARDILEEVAPFGGEEEREDVKRGYEYALREDVG